MKLSVQSKFNGINTYEKRKEMIDKEKLHMEDKIDYEAFLRLFEKYGQGFTEEEFAKYFLDMTYNNVYYLRIRKTKETRILCREYVSDDEISQIKNDVLLYYGLKPYDKLNYDEIKEIYLQYGGRVSLTRFAEEVFNVSPHTIECSKSDGESFYILREREYNEIQINSIKKKILAESKLHIGDLITLEQFKELYDKFGENIDLKVFALKVLETPHNSLNRFLRGIQNKMSVFPNYIVNPIDIFSLRERVIKEENLHINDLLSNEEFQRLYEKYGWILSEVMFAEDILDINSIGVKNMRVSGKKSAILTNIDIPEEFIEDLKERVVSENRLEQGQEISLIELKGLYQKYGGVLSERQFAEFALEIDNDRYNHLIAGMYKKVSILRYKETDFESIRKQIIAECGLHRDDNVTYKGFQRLHKKYAPNMPEYIFADRVLDIDVHRYNNIKFWRGDSKTYILYREKLPSREELQERKKTILRERKLHSKDRIDYKGFKKIYKKYGGIIPEYMFAEIMLDIPPSKLTDLKSHPSKKYRILLRTTMSEEEISKLREKVLIENSIYPDKQLSLNEFLSIYNKYFHTLSQIDFAEKILGISRQSIKNLRYGYSKTARMLYYGREKREQMEFSEEEISMLRKYLIEGLSEEQIATRLGVTLVFLRENRRMLKISGVLTEEDIVEAKKKIGSKK